MKKTIYSICMVIFEITLPLFLIMGAVLVYTQLFGAIIGDGKLVKTINSSRLGLLRLRLLRLHHELHQGEEKRREESGRGITGIRLQDNIQQEGASPPVFYLNF